MRPPIPSTGSGSAAAAPQPAESAGRTDKDRDVTPDMLSDLDKREICADHLGNLRALQRRAARTPLAPYLAEIPRCLVLATDPRCGDPQLTKTTALEVAGAATRAAGRMESLTHVDMALELSKAATRAYETACDLLTMTPRTTPRA